MPMIPRILSFPEAFPSALLVFFFFSFALETLLILVLVFSQKMRGNRSLIPYMPHLFFGYIVPFFFLGSIAGIGLLLSWCVSCHVNPERKIQLMTCRPVVPFHHVYIREWLSINFHGVLSQD
jgi:hypothetical protein